MTTLRARRLAEVVMSVKKVVLGVLALALAAGCDGVALEESESPACGAGTCDDVRPLKRATAVDLRPLMPAARNQGDRGTCAAFAATGLMEFLVREHAGEEVDLSESYNFWAAREYALSTDYLKDAYRHDDGLAGYLAVDGYRYGAARESDWPYEPENWYAQHDPRCVVVDRQYVNECFTGLPPAALPVLTYRIAPSFVDRREIGAFMLAREKPVVMNLCWYSASVDSTTGVISMPTGDPGTCYGHTILLVGYDAEQRVFTFRNSHGSDWGAAGYGTVPEQYVIEHCEACRFLDSLSQYDEDTQDLVRKTAQGVTGDLVIVDE
jgi:hypothetical protein